MKKHIRAYLDRAEKLIGKRTRSEIAFDDEVVAGLEAGLPIKTALECAGKRHPSEKLSCDDSMIADIASRYEYLKEHKRILGELKAG